MSLPSSEPLPDETSALPAARRRRSRRQIIPSGRPERAAFLTGLSQRLIPTLDFFLFSLLAGLVMGLGLLLDAPAFLVLAALLAPFMAPVVGLGLATIVGSGRFFLQYLGSLAIGSALVLACGALFGWLARSWPNAAGQAALHTHFSYPDFIVLSVGVALATYLTVRGGSSRPMAASAAIAYELYLPFGAAGFGLTSGAPGLWPDGLVVYAVYLAWAALVSTLVLAILGLRPLNAFGYTLGSTVLLVAIAAGVAASGFGAAFRSQVAMPTPVAPFMPSPTPTLTPSVTNTPRPPTATATPTNTLVPSRTPTLTVSPRPTAVFARIAASGADGAFIRAEPDPYATVVKTLLNGMLVEVLPDVVQTQGTTWLHVRTNEGLEGWILRSLLVVATPAAPAAATAGPTFTASPTVSPSPTASATLPPSLTPSLRPTS